MIDQTVVLRGYVSKEIITYGNFIGKDDVFIALLLAFYLGIDSVEEFLNCFGISLNSPCEHVNSVPMSDIKKAIQAGIHYDNIIYYLRETKE